MNSILKNILVIILILIILVLGQNAYFNQVGRNVYNWVSEKIQGVWNWIVEFWNKHLLGKVTSEIEKRQEVIQKEIDAQTEKVTESLWQKTKNYFIKLLGGSDEQPQPQTQQ